MQFPHLTYTTTNAKLGIDARPGYFEIRQRNPEVTMESKPATWNIERTPSKLTIDQTKAWNDMDLKHITLRVKEAADAGKQGVMEGIARRAGEGRELMAIENKGANPLVTQPKRNSQPPMHDINIGFIPSPGSVTFDYQPSKLNITWHIERPNINWKKNDPYIEYRRYDVKYNLEQKPSLHFNVQY